MVEIHQVEKRFGPMVALHPTDLTVNQGEFFSLLGPSGCGKTTLLRMIGGFEEASGGDIRIAGQSVIGVPPARRRTNMVFQHLALFPHMSVRRNIAFGLEMRRLPDAEIRRKVEEALAMVQMTQFGDRPVDALSGGQKQRIAIARALVNEPAVLLLDEPLSALDLQLRIQMQAELRRLQRATGSTFIFVTHDQEEAMTMSDRIAVMQAGRVLQLGTPREIYHRPEHRFVAEFIGHSNFLPAKVLGAGADGLVDLDCDGMRFRGVAARPVVTGAAVSVAIRYEAVSLAGVEEDGIAATLDMTTFAGAVVRMDLVLANGLAMTAEMPASFDQPDLTRGSTFRLRWQPQAALVLAD